MDQNIYKYNALENLHGDFENYINSKEHNYEIRLCIYDIVQNTNQKTFLRFLLQKKYSDELNFLSIYKNDYLPNQKPFLDYIKDNLRILFNGDISNCIMKGIYNDDNEEQYSYLFIDISLMKINLNDIYRSNPIWFTLIDEIINQKRVCDIKISEDVVNFFNYHSEFLFIQDENNVNIEIPSVVYVGKPASMLEFTYIFGVTKMNINEHLGPYYYFTDFENALKIVGNLKQDKKGIVRFAIFVGQMYIKINKDLSLISESDKNDLWTNTHDSVYLSEYTIYNTENVPIYVVKDYYQQIPLSFHYASKKCETII